MLDALVTFATMNIAFMVVAAIVGAYAVYHLIANARSASAQVDTHLHDQLTAIERERAEANHDMDIHARV
jgi:Na+/H+ antiporter NhaB